MRVHRIFEICVDVVNGKTLYSLFLVGWRTPIPVNMAQEPAGFDTRAYTVVNAGGVGHVQVGGGMCNLSWRLRIKCRSL